MNHIRDLKYQAEVSEAQRQEADAKIVELLSYLNSDKFKCGDELDGYVSINDVRSRLAEIRQSLYKDGGEFGIEADPDIRFRRVNYRQDILVEFEIMHSDGFQQNMIGRLGQILSDEASDFYDAHVGVHIVELFSAPGVPSQVFRAPTMTEAKDIYRSKVVEHVHRLIEAGQLKK